MNIGKELFHLWVMCIFLAITIIVGLTVVVIVMDARIEDLQGQINANKGTTVQNRGYIWDITYEVTGYPLITGYHDEETGESVTLYAFDNHDYPPGSRIDELYEEIWGNVWWGLGSPENQIYEECGYNDVKPGCPDSRLDIVFDELFIDPLSQDERGDIKWSVIDSIYENDVLYLFGRTSDVVKAICEIHPETMPLCAQ